MRRVTPFLFVHNPSEWLHIKYFNFKHLLQNRTLDPGGLQWTTSTHQLGITARAIYTYVHIEIETQETREQEEKK